MSQYVYKRICVYYDKKAYKELSSLPRQVQILFAKLLGVLEERGKLSYPEARKVRGKRDLYEMRVRHLGIWRGFYVYIEKNKILVLHFFHKKSQKTPKRNINLALERLKNHEE